MRAWKRRGHVQPARGRGGARPYLEPAEEDVLLVVAEMAAEDVDAAFVFSGGGDTDADADIAGLGDVEVGVTRFFGNEFVVQPGAFVVAAPAGKEAVLRPVEGHPGGGETATAAAHVAGAVKGSNQDAVDPAGDIGRIIVVGFDDFGAYFGGDFDAAGRFGVGQHRETIFEIAGAAGPDDLRIGAARVGEGGRVVKFEEPLGDGVHAAWDVDMIVNEETDGHAERRSGVSGAEGNSDGGRGNAAEFLLAAGRSGFDRGRDKPDGFKFTHVDRDSWLTEAGEGSDFAHGHGAVREGAEDSHAMRVGECTADLVSLSFIIEDAGLQRGIGLHRVVYANIADYEFEKKYSGRRGICQRE